MDILQDYTALKIKIDCDRTELSEFMATLFGYSQQLGFNSSQPLVKRELEQLCKKIYSKLKNPNTKKIKRFSFSYYECVAINYATHYFHSFGNHLSYDQVATKIERKFEKNPNKYLNQKIKTDGINN